jgi:hypothetical protein
MAIIKDIHDRIKKNNTTDTYDDASAEIKAINKGIKKKAKFYIEVITPKAVPLYIMNSY